MSAPRGKSSKHKGATAHKKQPVLMLPAVTFTVLQHRRRRRKHWAIFALSTVLVVELILCSAVLAQHLPAKVDLAGVFTARDFNGGASERSRLTRAAANYTLTVRYSGGASKSFAADEIGAKVDVDGSVTRAVHAQQADGYVHRLAWWRTLHVPLAVSVDNDQLAQFIAAHINEQITPPQDASLAVDNGTIKETTEVPGQGYSLPSPTSTIKAAVANLRRAPLQVSKQAIAPAISAKQLAPSRQKLERILAQKIDLTIDGHDVVASAADIGSWVEITPVSTSHTVDITVNSGKILEYLNGIAATYIQPPRTQIMATAADGSTTVIVPGHNGVDISGKDALAAKIADHLLDAKGITAEVNATYTPFKTIPAQSYSKWIEINLTTKRMYAYENTTQVRSFLISAGAPATPTVTGQFAIYSKLLTQTMSGANADGSRYVQPNVPYVNYFYKDYAIHGNYWRPASYFGNINSSHGCVGVQNDSAAWIYAWAPIGTPVLVHK